MSETTAKPIPAPETQKQRWLKYGANVVLASVVVILLAIILTYLAQRTNQRLDTTAAGLYSLKPQTVNIIRDIKQKITLISLYAPIQGARTEAERQAAEEHAARIDVVGDLLREYEYKGKNISVEIIDPIANAQRVTDLIKEFTKKYGGEVAQYQAVVDAQPVAYKQLKELIAAQLKKVNALPLEQLAGNEALQNVGLAFYTVQEFPVEMKRSEAVIQRGLADQPPDYKGVTANVQRTMEYFSDRSGDIVEKFTAVKDDTKLPEPIRTYATDSLPTYTEIKKISDDMIAKIKGLGELKLDDLRLKLKEENAILVLGENDMRSLSFNQVWKRNDEELRRLRPGEEVKAKAKFSGEQQITTAILALTQDKKPKVVFVRPGGGPLTSPGFPPFQPPGPFSVIASRLRDYNFEVLEKDLSGTWEMQARMRQQPAEPEPSDEEIKDAVWIVLSIPSGNSPMGPTPPMAPKVAEHLKQGGSALMLFYPQGEDLHEALADWGIDVDTNVIAVHEAVPSSGVPSSDMIEQAQRVPFIFVSNNYADHTITGPLQSLDSLLLAMMPVKTREVAGYTVKPLLALPQGSWGERQAEAALRGEPVKFDPPKDSTPGDVPGPIYVAAASEKQGGGRVVAIGGLEMARDQIVTWPDENLLRREQPIRVARFPGNAELIANSVFWLAKMEPLIAISPAAMEVSRIKPMSEGTLKAWRIGALLVGLPGLVIAAGAFVYLVRRD